MKCETCGHKLSEFISDIDSHTQDCAWYETIRLVKQAQEERDDFLELESETSWPGPLSEYEKDFISE